MAVYQEVARALEQEIRQNFRSGDYLPSEAVLAQRFSINRHTLRRAVDELIDAGMLLRQHGRGTQIIEHAVEYDIAARARFTESVEASGHHAEASIVDRKLMTADEALAQAMWIAPGSPVQLIETLRSVDGRPVTLISHYLNATELPDIARLYQGGSLHGCIGTHLGRRLSRRQGLISAVMPTRRESILLQFPRNMPLLKVRSNNVCVSTGAVLEYSVARSRCDAFEYRVQPTAEHSAPAAVDTSSIRESCHEQ
ncbi:phosphonate metabolism transcriptional regulator PhnF [Allohahella marinimesophila]|uniref:Phosphonate metabolism transcriptional regulator PhnF n=1 Tax=Allohahella marinimesophila TaxID=1054972 RepID=A0ABP7PMP7_9GAMM